MNWYNRFRLCNGLNLKWPPQNLTMSDPVLVQPGSSSDMFSFFPPPPPFLHILASLSFTSHLLPIFRWLFLPLFLSLYRMGRAASRIQRETSGLLRKQKSFNYSRFWSKNCLINRITARNLPPVKTQPGWTRTRNQLRIKHITRKRVILQTSPKETRRTQ